MAAPVDAPLIVITGPTASGKTALALELAAAHGGEIICADSRTVYIGLDIGTAKPSAAERARVPHHLLDVVRPDETYNLARFQNEAIRAIRDIRARGRVPFLVGGSGMYIDSIVLDYELGTAPNLGQRRKLNAMSLDELFQYSAIHNIKLPNNLYNKRYLIRAIEQGGINTNRRHAPIHNSIVVGIATPTEQLKIRISKRADLLFDDRLIDETTTAANSYGWDVPSLRAPAYKAVRRFKSNELNREQAVKAFARDDWQLARKQMTWMRRNGWIEWKSLEDAKTYLDSILVHRGSPSAAAEHKHDTIKR